ncbi:hypothetical protein ABT023_16305 [Micromonospora sp. NPDC002296]|uniref:hypothetical protein n=1 Tax=Micromonospora sp. NPDC002296 TaxID=3154271 RepID=UPI0033263BF2
MTQPWYTVTVVKHDVHPSQRQDSDPAPVEVVACTVEPELAGTILRATADQIAPRKPATRTRVEL